MVQKTFDAVFNPNDGVHIRTPGIEGLFVARARGFDTNFDMVADFQRFVSDRELGMLHHSGVRPSQGLHACFVCHNVVGCKSGAAAHLVVVLVNDGGDIIGPVSSQGFSPFKQSHFEPSDELFDKATAGATVDKHDSFIFAF